MVKESQIQFLIAGLLFLLMPDEHMNEEYEENSIEYWSNYALACNLIIFALVLYPLATFGLIFTKPETLQNEKVRSKLGALW